MDDKNSSTNFPTVRRFFAWLFSWRMIRRALIGFAGLLTLVAIFYTVENVRGHFAWKQFKAESEAKGERLDMAAVVPPPVPDAENFAMTPLLAPLLDYTKVPVKNSPFGETHWRDTNANQWLNSLDVTGARNNNKQYNKIVPGNAGWRDGKMFNLAEMQALYRSLTNLFPIAPQPQSPAEDVLLALSKFDKEMDELRTASLRPHSRFPIHYEENFNALLPHLSRPLRQFCLAARLRAIAELDLNRTDAALADVQFGLRLADAIKTEPLLISSLVRIAELEIMVQPIWEGLARRRWNETQLIELEKQLATVDMLAEFHHAIRGERNFSLEGLDLMRRNPRYLDAIGTIEGGSSPDLSPLLLIPGGWYDQNKITIAEMHRDYSLPQVDAKAQRIDMARMRANGEKVDSLLVGFHPYRVFAKLLYPAVQNASQKFVRSQTAVNEACIAIALERHRLKHGEFPEKLDALTPEFMAKIPHDIINGEPLHYRRTSDGLFVLYSVGWNEKDDGGDVVMSKNSNVSVDFTQGDLVWRYPAP